MWITERRGQIVQKKTFIMFVVLLFTCAFMTTTVFPADKKQNVKYITPSEIRNMGLKITKIKGLVIICEKTKGSCNLEEFSNFIKFSSTKILTRDHLDAIFAEQQLALSGLTQEEKSIKIGKLLQASHIMLYYQHIEGENLFVNNIKLINISTSEIEYQTKTYTLVSGAGIENEQLTNFFRIINYYSE